MYSKPLVSVLMIFLNEERFLAEAIESILAQTYENWELLLLDDGSTDASTQIALGYAEQYPEKVRYREHPGHQNHGMNATRNLGLRYAEGEYIAFMDGDDVWLPHKLEQQVAILESQPEAGLLYGNTQYWHSWTGNSEDMERDWVPELVVQTNTLFKPPALLTLSYPLGRGAAPSLSNLIVRREVVERTGGFEESFRAGYTDQVFLCKAYMTESVFVAGESECWDRYRSHPESYMAFMNATPGHYESVRQKFLKWFEEHLSEQEFEDKAVWKLLQQEKHVLRLRANMQKREWKQAVWSLAMLLRHHPRAFIRTCREILASYVQLRRRLQHLGLKSKSC